MAKYELLYTLPAKFTEDEIAQKKRSIADELVKLGVSVARNDEIGKIRLAYPIRHVRHGHYVLADLEVEPSALSKVNDFLRLHADVLRHQIVKPEPGSKPFVSLADPDARIERRDAAPAPVAPTVPMSQPRSAGPALTAEEIDKKLDALEEDITKAL